MRGLVVASLVLGVLAGLPAAAGAETLKPGSGRTAELNAAALSCDLGIEFNAFFQSADRRYGNVFDLGAGALISRVEFVHFGFETLAGPYAYDLEFWNDTGCTMLGAVTGLQAGDAFAASATESVNLCAQGLFFSGMVAVVVRPRSCADPPADTDCYPDLMHDPNLTAACPRIIIPATASCTNPINGGAFLLRIDIDGCPTPAAAHSWGTVKTLYR